MKEGGGGDNFAIAWQYPGQPRVVIPAKFSRLEPKIEVIQRPPMVGEGKSNQRIDFLWSSISCCSGAGVAVPVGSLINCFFYPTVSKSILLVVISILMPFNDIHTT